jgi:hypothetical protein
MTNKNVVLTVSAVVVALSIGYVFFATAPLRGTVPEQVDSTPSAVTLTGTYGCLPHLDTKGPQTEECAFGLKTDDGEYFAVNFGASASSAEQFRSGAHITAEGFVVPKEALNNDQWMKYNMKGLFTVTKVLESTIVQGKLNIDAVCKGALAYMTFPDAASADAFVAECKAGKHPEVLERYKAQLNVGEGAAI